MATTNKPRRQRLSPEKRKEEILDRTAEIVARDGIAQLTIDQIGKEAGISKSLVYAYFTNLPELLRTLYQREMSQLRRLQAQAAAEAETFEGLVRSITHVYLHYIHERGPLIDRLQAEPSVSDRHDPTEFNRDRAVDYLTDITVAHFGLPRDIARAATDISFGIPASAGNYLLGGTMDLETLEELTVQMILGTFLHLKGEYVARRQPLQRP